MVGGTVFFLVLGRGVLFPISCELGFYPLLVRVGAKGGAFYLPRTPSTLFHLPFEKKFFSSSSLFAFFSCIDLSARAWELVVFCVLDLAEWSGSLGLSVIFHAHGAIFSLGEIGRASCRERV